MKITMFLLALPLLAVAGSKEASTAANGASCRGVKPFYWEIGDVDKTLASGTVGAGPKRNQAVQIASASKWLYGAYVVEKGLRDSDKPFLQLRSGYESLKICNKRQTVAACVAGSNGDFTKIDVGRFAYDGGHMQKLASTTSLGGMNSAALGKEMTSVLGVSVSYEQAQLAGGAVVSAESYVLFMRKLMKGELKLGPLLGTDSVCTLPGFCATATRSPVPANWQYSLGHWAESPSGDGAFSSPGAFGFYPWISGNKKLYGVVARSGKPAAWAGAKCGAAIRRAFTS